MTSFRNFPVPVSAPLTPGPCQKNEGERERDIKLGKAPIGQVRSGKWEKPSTSPSALMQRIQQMAAEPPTVAAAHIRQLLSRLYQLSHLPTGKRANSREEATHD